MEFWEKEYERLLKDDKELKANAKPLSKEQLQKNIDQNWMEIKDEDGNSHFEPLIDTHMYIDLSNIPVPKESHPFLIIFSLLASLILVSLLLVCLAFFL